MDFLQDRLGPFAVWQWLAIAAAAIALSWAAQRYLLGDDEGGGRPTDPTQGDPYLGMQPTGPGVAPDGTLPPVSRDGDGGGGTARVDTNRKWLARALESVAGLGNWGHAQIDRALRRYLTGRVLSSEQMAIVNAALAAEGAPPGGAPPIEREDDSPPRDDPTTRRPQRDRTKSEEWEQRVRDYYAQGPASPGDYHPTQSGSQVVRRLGRQLARGDRQWPKVTHSIDLQHRAARQGLTEEEFNSG